MQVYASLDVVTPSDVADTIFAARGSATGSGQDWDTLTANGVWSTASSFAGTSHNPAEVFPGVHPFGQLVVTTAGGSTMQTYYPFIPDCPYYCYRAFYPGQLWSTWHAKAY